MKKKSLHDILATKKLSSYDSNEVVAARSKASNGRVFHAFLFDSGKVELQYQDEGHAVGRVYTIHEDDVDVIRQLLNYKEEM